MTSDDALLATSPPPGRADTLTVRRVEALEEYQECVAIQEETWGEGFSERVPASILLVSQKLGGVVAAAFAPGGRMLGFVFGTTGVMGGRLVHWSDMLAVRAEARGSRIGERLKRYQRYLVRPLGVETMLWTFDPLVARNAHLNLTVLGARATEYVPNMYGGNTRSRLHGGLATDRLVATWDLTRRAPGGPRPARRPAAAAAVAVVRTADGDGLPALAGLPDADAVRVAVPPDLHALAPTQQAAWRAVTREAFVAYLGRGYEIAAFSRGDGHEPPFYELVRPADRRA